MSVYYCDICGVNTVPKSPMADYWQSCEPCGKELWQLSPQYQSASRNSTWEDNRKYRLQCWSTYWWHRRSVEFQQAVKTLEHKWHRCEQCGYIHLQYAVENEGQTQ